MKEHAVQPARSLRLQRPVHLWVALLGASLWMAVAGNLPLWRRLAALQLIGPGQGWLLTLCLWLAITASLAAILGLFATRHTFKPAATLLLLATGCASYFMGAYGTLMTPGMLVNMLQTDLAEAKALVGPALLWHLAWQVVLPVALVWALRVDFGTRRRQLWRVPAWVVGGLAVVLLAVWTMFQPFSAAMRNHKELRYMLNPLAPIYSLARAATQGEQRAALPLQPIGEDARLATAPGRRPPLLVLVVGESARGANFGINGYPRPTTPELQAEGVLHSNNAWSCGTSTAESVPCMFAHLPRAQFIRADARYENLLDVLQRAGMAVLWVDNQGGCKGVCDRVPHAAVNTSMNNTAAPGNCAGGECLDMALLDGLDARIDALDPARRARGVVVVLHPMGNHGPAYFRRSSAAFKPFQPECTSEDLHACSRESLRNAYDNAITYTDHFLASTIGWLKTHGATQDTALMYVSDHGESLGENNLYLHGMPYALSPEDQRHIAWITWLSPGFAQATATSIACLRGRSDVQVSHDNYFHSVLGLLGVTTQAYRADLDMYAPCRHLELEGGSAGTGRPPDHRHTLASSAGVPTVVQ